MTQHDEHEGPAANMPVLKARLRDSLDQRVEVNIDSVRADPVQRTYTGRIVDVGERVLLLEVRADMENPSRAFKRVDVPLRRIRRVVKTTPEEIWRK